MDDQRHAVIEAILAGDGERAAGLLTPDATFRSPVRDYAGAERFAPVLRALGDVLAGMRATRVIRAEGETVAFFAGRIDGRDGDGVLRVAGSPPSDVTLMVRPLSTLRAGIARMAALLG